MNPGGSPITAPHAPSPKSRLGSQLTRLLVGPLPPDKSAILVVLLRAQLLPLLCLFFLPTYFYDLPGFGAEPSWKLTLTRALSEGWSFGDRLIWTYGPLGFLEWRYPYGIHPACYVAFDLVLLLIFLRFAIDVSKSKPSPLLAWACLASLFTVKRMLHDQPTVAVYCALLLLVLRQLSQPGVLNGTALILVSAVLLLLKMNFGLMGFFLSLTILVFQAARHQRSALAWLLLLSLQIILAWVLALKLHTHLFNYLQGSLAIITQYSDMSWGPGPGGVSHWFVFGFFWLFVLLAAIHLRKNRLTFPDALYLVIAAAANFVLYKTALIRSDYNHNKCFLLGFPILCLGFLIYAPETRRRLWRVLFLGSTAYASLLMVAEFGNALIYMHLDYLKVFFPVNYAEGIKDYRNHSTWEDYVRATLADTPGRVVPPGVRELIGTNTVDVLPFESTLALGSGLNYQPRPVPLTYGVMGKKLEARNLLFFESAQAPRFLLYVLGQAAYSIDGRYCLWDEPAVKRLLARQYQPVQVFTNVQGAPPETEPRPSPVMLLRRTADVAPPPALVSGATAQGRTGQSFVLPEQPEELYARIRLRKTWLGHLATLFYRGPEVVARFTLEDRTVRELRVLPSNLEAGVLVNYFADNSNPAHLVNFLVRHSRGNPKCLELAINPQRSWAYQSQFEITYLREGSSPSAH